MSTFKWLEILLLTFIVLDGVFDYQTHSKTPIVFSTLLHNLCSRLPKYLFKTHLKTTNIHTLSSLLGYLFQLSLPN